MQKKKDFFTAVWCELKILSLKKSKDFRQWKDTVHLHQSETLLILLVPTWNPVGSSITGSLSVDLFRFLWKAISLSLLLSSLLWERNRYTNEFCLI